MLKYPFFLPTCNETWISQKVFLKNPQISDFMKIRPVGTKSFPPGGRADRQTDEQQIDEVHSRFSQFCERT